MPLALRVTRILVVPRLYTSQTYVTAVLECYYYYYFFLNILVAVCVLRIFDLYACTRRVRVCTTQYAHHMYQAGTQQHTNHAFARKYT